MVNWAPVRAASPSKSKAPQPCQGTTWLQTVQQEQEETVTINNH